jgi:lipid A 4'-phosphatase
MQRYAYAIAAYAAALALAALLFLLFPGIDLWASGLFYRPGEGFFLGASWPARAVYAAVPYLVDAVVVGVPAFYLVSALRRRPLARIDGPAAAFLLLSLAFGPGLVVNAAFKDHWGRARPAQVTEFGGTRQFTAAPLPADQCARNCSFPAGHPAVGFYLVSFAFLVREARRRRLAIGAAMAAGGLIGLVRLMQGGHFLSDVVFSGLIVYATSWLTYHAVMTRDRWRRIPLPPPRVALCALALGAVILLSIFFVDRPLAYLFHDTDEHLRDVFRVITRFGEGETYLVISALLFAGLRIAARLTRDAERARQLLLGAYRALFVFLALAAAGLVTDLAKVTFGRARPKLLFLDGIYGFTWGATRADLWSFPSGHATTIVALTTALWLLWPRALPAWLLAALLVCASRVIITAHYLSDVIAGAAVGATFAWAVWIAFARAGVALGERAVQPPPRVSALSER